MLGAYTQEAFARKVRAAGTRRGPAQRAVPHLYPSLFFAD